MVAELDGDDAFAALMALLGNDDDSESWSARSPSIDRLRRAIGERPVTASPLDLAVLLRQALRHIHESQGYLEAPSVLVAHPLLSDFVAWDRIGMQATATPGGSLVTAKPWRPDWLAESDQGSVDAFAVSEVDRRKFDETNIEGDPFLAALDRDSYRSRGQRAAVRAALSTPAGATLVVALPTGEGKSMIFQLAHRVGFVGASHTQGKSVILVIVPTVSLGVNHEKEAIEICNLTGPLTYQGGSDEQNSLIAQRIEDGSQGLCFASPEAACGRLRSSLRTAAEAGYLSAIIIDEAHLVDQWGTGFRTDFQELSSLREELLAASPEDQRIRTLLLSATLTDSSRETLRALFGVGSDFESLQAVQLRPEPDYWIAPVVDDSQRIERVLKAIHHVPRPAILYVTEPETARTWHHRLNEAGFRRLRRLDGKTDRKEREAIVSNWRKGAIDIVVGTSAFGLGIDYANARSVIHACVPETLDRFYQEVGRGGRDGKASLSLIVPAAEDFGKAEAINKKTVISVGRGLERWSTMFERKCPLADGRYAVRVDGQPGTNELDIDMTGDANADWNLRTLVLMARAGMIRLFGKPTPAPAEKGDWLEIEFVDDRHLDLEVWKEKVEPVREEIRIASQRNLDLMRAYLRDERCPGEVLEELYGAHRVGLACSRCRQCRAAPVRRHPTKPVGEPRAPWTLPLHPTIANLLDGNRRLLVTYAADIVTRREQRRLGDALQSLQRVQLVKLLLLGDPPFDMARLLAFAENAPFFVSAVSSLARSRLPPGPELVLVGPEQSLVEQNLWPDRKSPRIFMAPEDQQAPDGRRLRDVFGGRTLTLDEFFRKAAQ